MTSPTSGFFRNKRMWMGFGIAGGICLINGLSLLFPQVPTIPVKRRYFVFAEGPLALFADYSDLIRISFYPYAIGILFLMPLDMLFSTAFFCGMNRAEHALGRVTGWDSLPRYPFQREQILGGFLGLCVLLLWVGWGHFTLVLKRALGRGGNVDDAGESLPY